MSEPITTNALIGIDKPNGRELVDMDRLADWMDSFGLGDGPIEDVVSLSGGSQNVLLRFDRAGRSYVLRRPPLHPTMNGSETMRREARVLKALAPTDVPHARLVADCSNEDVLGAAFYLMEPVEGFNAGVETPPALLDSPAARRDMGLDLVDVLARLGQVDYLAAGLADFGKADGFLERQVPRWRGQLESYSRHEGWAGAESLPGVEEIGRWLEANIPSGFIPGIMHGDYHLKNVMFRHDTPRIAAVVDWELTTIGDPLLDLGWVLATWRMAGEGPQDAIVLVEPWDGFPDPSELVERYALSSRRDLGTMSWYAVLACYKLGIVLEGSYARALAGKAPMEIGERLHGNVLRLLDKAQRWIDEPIV